MKLDHVGVAVNDLEEAVAFYREAFRLRIVHREEVASQNVRVAFLADASGAETQVELLEPLGEAGAVAKFLCARGPGVHHVAFRSEEIVSDMARLRAEGRPPIEDRPRAGSRGHDVCFIHPKHAQGVLIELVGHHG